MMPVSVRNKQKISKAHLKDHMIILLDLHAVQLRNRVEKNGVYILSSSACPIKHALRMMLPLALHVKIHLI